MSRIAQSRVVTFAVTWSLMLVMFAILLPIGVVVVLVPFYWERLLYPWRGAKHRALTIE